MNSFNWGRTIAYGFTLWLLLFAASSAFIGLRWYDMTIPRIILALLVGIAVYIAGRIMNEHSSIQAMEHGLVWVIIGIALDALILYQFNHDIFRYWEYWITYAAILIVPAFSVRTIGRSSYSV